MKFTIRQIDGAEIEKIRCDLHKSAIDTPRGINYCAICIREESHNQAIDVQTSVEFQINKDNLIKVIQEWYRSDKNKDTNWSYESLAQAILSAPDTLSGLSEFIEGVKKEANKYSKLERAALEKYKLLSGKDYEYK